MSDGETTPEPGSPQRPGPLTNDDTQPVSYTHLTLPTIYSV